MVGLIKIKSASLIENLIAMVLLIFIFTMAAASLHFFFQKSLSTNHEVVRVDFEKRYYQYIYGKIQLPLEYSKNNLHYYFYSENLGRGHQFVLTVKDSLDKIHFKKKREAYRYP